MIKIKVENGTHNISHVQKSLWLAQTDKSIIDMYKPTPAWTHSNSYHVKEMWAVHIARQDRV